MLELCVELWEVAMLMMCGVREANTKNEELLTCRSPVELGKISIRMCMVDNIDYD